MAIVHYDNGNAPPWDVFCEAVDQSGLMTRTEANVTCPACIERFRSIDQFTPRARVDLAAASRRIDWFGDT